MPVFGDANLLRLWWLKIGKCLAGMIEQYLHYSGLRCLCNTLHSLHISIACSNHKTNACNIIKLRVHSSPWVIWVPGWNSWTDLPPECINLQSIKGINKNYRNKNIVIKVINYNKNMEQNL